MIVGSVLAALLVLARLRRAYRRMRLDWKVERELDRLEKFLGL